MDSQGMERQYLQNSGEPERMKAERGRNEREEVRFVCGKCPTRRAPERMQFLTIFPVSRTDKRSTRGGYFCGKVGWGGGKVWGASKRGLDGPRGNGAVDMDRI